MKLRIKGNTIRLRFSQSEVSRIDDGFEVLETTCFGPENILQYTFQASDVPHMEAKFSQNTIAISAPKDRVAQWCKNEEDVGFDHTISFNDGESLYLLVEKDFKCLSDREEDESDLFENPDTDKIC